MEALSKAEHVSVMESTALALVEVCKRDGQELTQRAMQIVIVDDASYAVAVEMLKEIKRNMSGTDARFEPITQAANKLHKDVVRLRTEAKADYVAADAVLRPACLEWDKKQEAARRAEEARLRAEAQKKIDEEARRQQEAEQKRLDEEALRKAVETGDDSILENVPKAELVNHEAPPVVVESFKPAGFSTRENWDFEILDVTKIPQEYMIPNDVMIRKVVKALKDRTNIPGIKAYDKGGSTVRA